MTENSDVAELCERLPLLIRQNGPSSTVEMWMREAAAALARLSAEWTYFSKLSEDNYRETLARAERAEAELDLTIMARDALVGAVEQSEAALAEANALKLKAFGQAMDANDRAEKAEAALAAMSTGVDAVDLIAERNQAEKFEKAAVARAEKAEAERDALAAALKGDATTAGFALQAAAKANAALAEVSAAIGTVEFMDPPDGGDVTLAEQVRRMKAALTEARQEREKLIGWNEKAAKEVSDHMDRVHEIEQERDGMVAVLQAQCSIAEARVAELERIAMMEAELERAYGGQT